MKIAHVVLGIQRASGVSVFVGELVREQVALGHDVTIFIYWQAADIYPMPANVHIICRPDISRLKEAFDIVHVHGMWELWLTRMACHFHKIGARIVWSPHGNLTSWALKYKWWKKIPALLLYKYASLRSADAIHVTAQSEVEDIRRLYLRNKLVIAPLGVRLPELKQSTPVNKTYKTVLFVSRVQRKKGLPNLLEAWATIPASLKNGWKIQIAGPDQDNHTAELKAQSSLLGIEGEVEFLGPVYGEEKDDLYQQADIFVLPTHSENFGSVVIEALAANTPVICTKGAPWQELEECNCGKWIDIGVKPLADALQEMMALTDEARIEMGLCGRKLVQDKYEWGSVAKEIENAYAGLLCR